MRTIEDEVTFNWISAVGDTLKEKYESLHVLLCDSFAKLPANKGVLTIQCSPHLCVMFDTWGYWSPFSFATLYVNGILRYMGEVHGKWALWQDPFMSDTEMWLYNDVSMVKIWVNNFVY
jgi:hypothetical protein